MPNPLKRPLEPVADGTCDPQDIFLQRPPPTIQWQSPGSRSTLRQTHTSSTEAQPETACASTRSAETPITSKFCCPYNPSGSGQTTIAFYTPPSRMGSTTILLPVTSQYCPENKVMGISQHIFLPVKDKAGMSNWTREKRAEICSQLDSVFKKLQVDKKLSKALYDKVADKLASRHMLSARTEKSDADKNDELMRTMNSLFKIERCAELAGVYTLKFGEGRMEPGDILDDEAYEYNSIMRDPPSRSITLVGGVLKRLPVTLASGTCGPTQTVQRLVWGSASVWEPEGP